MTCDMLRFMKDKVVLVTGGGRGIGRAAVSLFANAGAKIAFCARTEGERLGVEREVTAAGGIVRAFAVNIASQREVNRMVSEIIAQWGKIDLLINNAGVLGAKKTLATYPPDTWDEVIRINVNGTFHVTRARDDSCTLRDHSFCFLFCGSQGPCDLGGLCRF